MNQLTFEILLNPSVPEIDELRLARQSQRMYRLFVSRYRSGLSVSTMDLTIIGAQYNARLYELRRALIPRGWCIDLVRRSENGIAYYKIVRLDESEFYKKLQVK